MKFSNLFAIVLMLFCQVGYSADETKPTGVDVPPIAERETERRGNMVQEIGTIQAGVDDAIADALAVPEDDSHRWFLTVVTKKGDRLSDKLVYDFGNQKELRSWAEDSHYHVREIGDETQRDWLTESLKAKIMSSGGLPCVVIQPPRNGEYGPNATVVGLCGGYDTDALKMSARIRAKVKAYVAVLYKNGHIKHIGDNSSREGGHAQSGEVIGAPPPFAVPNKPLDPSQPFGPLDYPVLTPPKPPEPVALTLAELKVIAPDAPSEFLLSQLESKATDKHAVELAWLKSQVPKPIPKVDDKPDTPLPEPDANFSPAQTTPSNAETGTAIVIGLSLGLSLPLSLVVFLWNRNRSQSSRPSPRSRASKKSKTQPKPEEVDPIP